MNNSDVLLTDAEMAKLQAAATEDEWNDTCDEVKHARGGAYPKDWFVKVIASGLIARKGAAFDSIAKA